MDYGLETVIPGVLLRSSRPGYRFASRSLVAPETVQEWVLSVQACGVRSIICLLGEEHLKLYRPLDLLQVYRQAGFEVAHIPVTDHLSPPLSDENMATVEAHFHRLAKPVLIHCSAGQDRTGAAIGHLLSLQRSPLRPATLPLKRFSEKSSCNSKGHPK